MLDPQWVSFWTACQALLLFLNLFAVGWYVVETIRLRRVAQQQVEAQIRPALEVVITLSSKNSWSTANFALRAKCNRPCFGINVRLEGGDGWTPQFHTSGRQTQLIFLTPAVVLPTMRVLWEVRSLDKLPVMVGNGELIALQ